MNPPLGGVDTQLHSLSISPPLGVAFRREIFFARRSRGPKNQNRLNVHRHKNLTLLLSSTDTRPVLDNNNVKFSRCVFLVDYFFLENIVVTLPCDKNTISKNHALLTRKFFLRSADNLKIAPPFFKKYLSPTGTRAVRDKNDLKKKTYKSTTVKKI